MGEDMDNSELGSNKHFRTKSLDLLMLDATFSVLQIWYFSGILLCENSFAHVLIHKFFPLTWEFCSFFLCTEVASILMQKMFLF